MRVHLECVTSKRNIFRNSILVVDRNVDFRTRITIVTNHRQMAFNMNIVS